MLPARLQPVGPHCCPKVLLLHNTWPARRRNLTRDFQQYFWIAGIAAASCRIANGPLRSQRAPQPQPQSGQEDESLPTQLIPQEFFDEPEVDLLRDELRQCEDIRRKVREDLEIDMEDKVWESLKTRLRPSVMDELKEDLEAEVRQTLKEELAEELGVEVEIDPDADLDDESDIGDDVQDEPEDQERVADDEDEYEVLQEKAEKAIASIMSMYPDVPPGIQLELREEIENELRRDMKAEVVQELQDELEEVAREELIDDLEEDAVYELREELEEEVRNDLLWAG
mmetsp:Transcript_56617/g.106230  ORF Transcript_56617/g.106230 Transcript_56617/m.106230 type:complete len:284 (+) Transcript_56617:20-871(+)